MKPSRKPKVLGWAILCRRGSICTGQIYKSREIAMGALRWRNRPETAWVRCCGPHRLVALIEEIIRQARKKKKEAKPRP